MKSAPPLLLLSPAKTLNFDSALSPALRSLTPTEPRFLERCSALADRVGSMSKSEIKSLMSLSDSLAQLNHARYSAFAEQPARIALGAFEGAAYKGLQASTLDAKQLEYLGRSLRILCGQYGILLPTDEIRPYRLEMSTKLAVGDAPNLYKYWGDSLTASLRAEEPPFVVNVASQEYAKALDMGALGCPVITCAFPGPAVHAKQARGEMVRFCAEQQVVEPAGLRAFRGSSGQWSFVEAESSETTLVFHRGAAASAAKPKAPAAGKRKR